MENNYRCIPFWSWNDDLNIDELLHQIEWMSESNIGGCFIHARSGLKTKYLSDEWFTCVDLCVKKAKEKNLDIYIYDENGWPSGFVGGKLLSDIKNRDTFLTYSFGEFDKNAFANYDNNSGKRISEGTCCVNVYLNYSVSTVDILNAEVVKKFIYETHRQYNKRVNGIKGFFTDEPQFCGQGVAFSFSLISYFEQTYNMDLLEFLGLLFVKGNGYRAFRYKYWKSMQTLMIKNYAKQLYDYCEEHKYLLTGHYYEERSIGKQILGCGGVMPFYEYEHIPGIDWLGKLVFKKDLKFHPEYKEFLTNDLAPKQLGSVCAQLGKKKVLTEMGAMLGWDETPLDLKTMAEFQFVNGVNTICWHLIPYSENGQRKRDYPPHFSDINPWVKSNFAEFNKYFENLGEILEESSELVNVGVIHPLQSGYFEFDASKEKEGFGTADIDEPFFKLLDILAKKHVSYHLIDETILKKYGKIEGQSLIVGKCKYDYIIIPKMFSIDKSTDKILREFLDNAGKLCVMDVVPQYLEGEEHDLRYIKSNISLEKICLNQSVHVSDALNIRVSVRERNNEKFIYAVNLGEKTTVDFKINGVKSFKNLDVISGATKLISTKVDFDKNESKILYFDYNVKVRDKTHLSKLRLGKTYNVVDKTTNYLPLDFVEYSFNGEEYYPPKYHMALFDELLKSRYSGKLFLKYSFDVKNITDELNVMFEDNNIISVAVNNHFINDFVIKDKVNKIKAADIKKYLILGRNEIILNMDYYQSEDVYYALFGKGVSESLRNCLVYSSTIESIYLFGDFGVFGNFRNGSRKEIIEGNNFYLDMQKTEIQSIIKDGFPFLRGKISLYQRVKVKSVKKFIRFADRFSVVDLQINGKHCDTLMLKRSSDISKYLHVGFNDIILTLTIDNKNLLGENHSPDQYLYFVRPNDFEKFGTWDNGKSYKFTKNYYLIKTII